jgi:hypothetical protein
MMWDLLAAGFMKRHVLPLWLHEELKAAQRPERALHNSQEEEEEEEQKKKSEEEGGPASSSSKLPPPESRTKALTKKMEKIFVLLAQTVELELDSSVRHGVTLPTSFPFRPHDALPMQQLAFLQKSLFSLAAKADTAAAAAPRSVPTTPEDEQRWKRVQERKAAVARFYSGLVFHYARVVLGMATRTLSGPLWKNLLATPPSPPPAAAASDESCDKSSPSEPPAAATPAVFAAKEREAGDANNKSPPPPPTTDATGGGGHRAMPSDLIEASFVGTLLPTLVTSLCGRAGNTAFVATLLPELVPLVERVDKLGSLLPQTARSEKAVFSILTRKQPNARYA